MKETKNCPHCGKEILAVARKCKHCRMWIDDADTRPYAMTESQTAIPNQEPVSRDDTALPPRPNNRKFWGGIGVGAAASLLLALILHFSARKEELYLMDIMQPNMDYSFYVGVATDDFGDRLAAGKGWCGDLQIVTYKPGTRPGKFRHILSGARLQGDIFDIFPSGKYPSLIYFNGSKYDGFEPFYGKVDIQSGKYDIFEGDLLGLISRGRYKDCYLTRRGDTLMVFPQSPAGESYDPVLSFDPREYFGDADLSDPGIKSDIINWIEAR